MGGSWPTLPDAIRRAMLALIGEVAGVVNDDAAWRVAGPPGSYNAEMRFSFESMFVATAFVAVASLAAKYGVASPNVFCLLACPS